MPPFRFPLPRRVPGRVRRLRWTGFAVAVAVALSAAGCTDDTPAEPLPEASGEFRYVKQGTQTAYEDMLIGLMDVSAEGEALLQVYADDAESEVVRAEEGDTFQVGHRSVTVVRVGTDPDGVLLGIVDPEDTPAPDGSPSRRPTAEPEPETEDAFGGNQRSG
ncbi:MAG TPA: hypothetical protein VKZ89_15600 [Thermobifida alba]|nr:hypothetical protein [Thermobifida alba]